MKTNKGVIGLGLILAIVLGVAVVGGGAYYLGTKEKGYKSEDDYGLMLERLKETYPELNQKLPVVENKKTSEISSECNQNSPSTIKLISPNGGETYTVGQKITIKWESCNLSKDTKLHSIGLSMSVSSGAHTTSLPIIKDVINDGFETLSLDNNVSNYFGNKTDGYPFKIYIGAGGPDGVYDESDNPFIINSGDSKTIPITGEYGDDINGRHIGAIESINSKNNLVIDYVQWISPCSLSIKVAGCENGYQIVNDNKKLRSFLISDSVLIKLQTYSHTDDGSFNWNQTVSLPVFKNALNTSLLYWITLKDGKVVEITEQYQS